MRGVVLRAAGAPDVLVAQDVPDPVVGAGDVLVRTEAIGVHFVETQMRSGTFPVPADVVFGTQAAGVVVEVGTDVDRDWLGVRVVARTQHGAYAELVAVSVEAVTPVPD